MENSFKQDYENIIEILLNARSGIESVKNPEIESLVTRLRLDLTRHINFLKVRIGEAPDAERKPVRQPLTKIMGKTVITEDGAPAGDSRPIQTTPKEIELKELKEKTEDIYSKFSITPTDQLYDTLSDIEIRAVAKKAGLPVTDNTPKRIDTSFIEKIKEAIIKKHSSGILPVPGLDEELSKLGPDGNDEDLLNDLNLKDNPTGLLGTKDESDLITTDEQVNTQKTDIDGNQQILQELTSLTNSAILEAYDEDQIKEFAKLAGVEVSDKTKVDSKFITQLKETIKSAGSNK